MKLLECKNVNKRFGRKEVLKNVNLTIPKGKIIGLLGPNGSGKTTLIKLINGLLEPNSGEILVKGEKVGTKSKKIISYLPERSYVDFNMKVKELIKYFSDFYDNFDPKRALSMLDSLQIDKNAAMKSLSKGTKEKVQLVLVMSRDADLYILDEPIAGVDPAARDYILKTIISNYNENASILLSTHLISDIEAVLDDVIFIRDGQLLLYSSVEDIRSNYGKSIDGYFREVFAC